MLFCFFCRVFLSRVLWISISDTHLLITHLFDSILQAFYSVYFSTKLFHRLKNFSRIMLHFCRFISFFFSKKKFFFSFFLPHTFDIWLEKKMSLKEIRNLKFWNTKSYSNGILFFFCIKIYGTKIMAKLQLLNKLQIYVSAKIAQKKKSKLSTIKISSWPHLTSLFCQK